MRYKIMGKFTETKWVDFEIEIEAENEKLAIEKLENICDDYCSVEEFDEDYFEDGFKTKGVNEETNLSDIKIVEMKEP